MFLDTSGLLAVLDLREPLHRPACALFAQANRLLTHSYVLAELVALARQRKFSAARTLEFVRELVETVEVHWPTKAETTRAISLLSSRPDVGYSLCDAVSFLVMREAGVTAALTSDIHFEQEGFQRLLV